MIPEHKANLLLRTFRASSNPSSPSILGRSLVVWMDRGPGRQSPVCLQTPSRTENRTARESPVPPLKDDGSASCGGVIEQKCSRSGSNTLFRLKPAGMLHLSSSLAASHKSYMGATPPSDPASVCLTLSGSLPCVPAAPPLQPVIQCFLPGLVLELMKPSSPVSLLAV